MFDVVFIVWVLLDFVDMFIEGFVVHGDQDVDVYFFWKCLCGWCL